ncbi:MAG: hypothetical protein HKN91_04595 [Acidimicrobiia bacterium]|nr:hypothetical protein [Acidimicrobiia bacterium]
MVTPLGTKELGAASKKHAELIKQFLLAGLNDDQLGAFADQMTAVVERLTVAKLD